MSTTARTTTTRVLAAALLGGLALAGCSAPAGPAPASAPAAPGNGANPQTHNQADVRFAGGMIVHHRQALQMTRLVPGRSADPQVADLARRIEAAQGPEISIMTGMLQRWGAEEAVHPDHEAMNHGEMAHGGTGGMDHGGMDGMMTADQMAQLDRSSGAAFDRLFLQLMTAHHEGAVRMAQAQVEQGSDAEAVALARAIIDAQQGEINEMQGMLARA
ncbi:DUF305 domain-containing protein [Pseudonocardia acidicola]|uniref:DUF305 domain-containing protein n=1 Tax=Pseudonocardia acidicola TaxID=2724939 RepID=A0ABX1SAT4_9PSEU|nr:DUF305 domain-containing protein [Pseudonocardia acidicola]NMH97677.1 DUF305 domain-containing protein [Pseudonocardia acidicola]